MEQDLDVFLWCLGMHGHTHMHVYMAHTHVYAPHTLHTHVYKEKDYTQEMHVGLEYLTEEAQSH